MKKFLQAVGVWVALAFACSLASAQTTSKNITAINSTPTATCSANSCVVFDMLGKGAAAVQVTGTYTASGGLSAQVTADGTTWVTLGATTTFKRLSTGVTTATITSGQQDVYQLSSDCTGAFACRITALGAVTGTATITPVTSIASIGGGSGAAAGLTDAELRATPVPVSGTVTAAGVAQGSTTSGQTGGLTQCAVTTAAPTYTTGQTSPVSCDTSGNVRITGAGGGGTSSTFGAAVPSAGTAAGLSDGTNMVLPRAFDADSGAGTQTVAGVSLRKAASGGSVEAGTSSDPLRTDPTGTTAQPATQSGVWTARVQDGSGNAITSAARGAERAVSVQIVDGSGAQVTSFGGSGGTASNFGSAVPATGTAAGVSDGTNMVAPRSFDADSGAGTQNVLGISLRKAASGGSVEAGTSTDPLRTDPTGTTTQPVSGTVSITANSAVNVAQMNGVATSMGAGVNGTGVQRVTIATDDAMSTAIVGVAHDAAGGTVNPALVGCYASAAAPTDVSADTDATRAWCLRNGSRAVTPTYAGVLPSTGNGTAGTGTPRGALASDNSAIANWGHGAVGSAVPSNATFMGGRTGANTHPVPVPDTTAKIDVSTATTVEIVALSASQKIWVGAFSLLAGGTGNIKFVYGTGTNCATGITDLTGNYNLTAQNGVAQGSGLGAVLVVPSGNALCVTTSAAVQMSGHVTYTKF
jgi:hypothetical protein